MARKLATIRKISALEPIEGADLIELAHIDGWQCVVKKGEFKVGDLGLYFEIDSFVDTSKEPFCFLEKNAREWRGLRGAVIKTMKLKGQLSQGLLLPIHPYFTDLLYIKIGGVRMCKLPPSTILNKDYTTLLNVHKYEKESPDGEEKVGSGWFHNFLLRNVSRENRKKVFSVLNFFLPQKKRFKNHTISTFPSYIPKTDEERIQNIFERVKRKGGDYWATVKLDGSSATYFSYKGEFGHCSRNLKLGINDGSNFSKIALKYRLNELLPVIAEKVGFDFALQGELIGPGIQGNKEKLEDHDYYIFKIWDISNKRYLNLKERLSLVEEFFAAGVHLKQVPVLGYVSMDQFSSVQDFLTYAEGPSLVNEVREGVVFENDRDQTSFKAISNKFLLKYKE